MFTAVVFPHNVVLVILTVTVGYNVAGLRQHPLKTSEHSIFLFFCIPTIPYYQCLSEGVQILSLSSCRRDIMAQCTQEEKEKLLIV